MWMNSIQKFVMTFPIVTVRHTTLRFSYNVPYVSTYSYVYLIIAHTNVHGHARTHALYLHTYTILHTYIHSCIHHQPLQSCVHVLFYCYENITVYLRIKTRCYGEQQFWKSVKCNRERVKTGSTLCTARTRKNGLTQAQRSDYRDVVIRVSQSLMYARFHRGCASRDSIVKVMAALYTSDTLSEAKCLLSSHFEDSNLLEPMQTRLTSCNRTDREAISDAILRGIGSLIENDINIQCVARD